MTAATDTHPAASAVDLGPEVTIPHAAALRDRLLQLLADGRASLALDLGGVTDVDSAGIQLLLATRRTLAERGGTLHLTAASGPVRDALRVFGLEALAEAPAAT